MTTLEPSLSPPLPKPARYLPWLRQRDPLAAGLYRFGHDFGNGVTDTQVFQFDNQYDEYRRNGLRARQHLERYYRRQDLGTTTEQAVTGFIVGRLCHEHPGWFHTRGNVLHCVLSNENLSLRGKPRGYVDLLDALAAQLQEDIAVIQFEADGTNRLAALHLCCPNHWGADQRIGQDFSGLHEAVPGFDQAYRHADRLLEGILARGPYVRFVWGLGNNRQLDQHPGHQQRARQFGANDDIYVRVERQVLWGLPAVNALLFIIRTYFVDTRSLQTNEIDTLQEQVRSMQPEMLRYKGLLASRESILRHLGQLR